MTSLTIPYNKLVAAQELITDAIHDLADYPCDEKNEMGYVASLTWLGGDLATVIKELEEEAEE